MIVWILIKGVIKTLLLLIVIILMVPVGALGIIIQLGGDSYTSSRICSWYMNKVIKLLSL